MGSMATAIQSEGSKAVTEFVYGVIDRESSPSEIVGEYARTEEDCIVYWRESDGTLAYAPADCVSVVPAVRTRPGCPLRRIAA